VLVACADKLHNARAILADYRMVDEALRKRFSAGAENLWYYRSLADTFLSLGTPLAEELDRVVTELEELVGQNTVSAWLSGCQLPSCFRIGAYGPRQPEPHRARTGLGPRV
jgi:hypothetical protein